MKHLIPIADLEEEPNPANLGLKARSSNPCIIGLDSKTAPEYLFCSPRTLPARHPASRRAFRVQDVRCVVNQDLAFGVQGFGL